MMVSLIAAISKNNVIGTGEGGIPWRLPRDREHFRAYTKGKWMLLGRRTFLEMSGWFTDQTPVVLTRSPDFLVADGFRVNSVGEAIELARDNGVDELVVSGGAEIYEAALPMVEKLVLTEVDAEAAGTVFFPMVSFAEWERVEKQVWAKDAENSYDMVQEVFLRRCR